MTWTFTSDSRGYMLFKDGVPQGGAGTLSTRTHTRDGQRRHWRHIRADITMFRDTAARLCARHNTDAKQ